MVMYDPDFKTLADVYPYDEVMKVATRLSHSVPHQVQVGWMNCPCKPVVNCGKTYSNWGDTAWKYELVSYADDNTEYYKIGYLHQTPIMIACFPPNRQDIFHYLQFDSSGILSKSTVAGWDIFFNQIVKDSSLSSHWNIITKRVKKAGGGKMRQYNLVNSKDGMEYLIKDGLTIEYKDVFMDWLGL